MTETMFVRYDVEKDEIYLVGKTKDSYYKYITERGDSEVPEIVRTYSPSDSCVPWYHTIDLGEL